MKGKKIIAALLAVTMLLPVVFIITSCGREDKYSGALKIGATSLPKNLNPYSSSSDTFFVDMFYDTLLGVTETPVGYTTDPEGFRFPDGSEYVPPDTSVNPLEFTDNLLYYEGALPRKDGSEYGYVYFDPTEEQWREQCERESIVKGFDEEGNPIEETDEEFYERAIKTVPDTNWMEFRFKVREGYTWNDGTPFTAEDIKFTFDYITVYKASLSSQAFFLTDYYESRVEEDGDFVFILSSNNYSSMKSICNSIVVLPKHIWSRVTKPQSEKNLSPVGTGPYYLAENDYIADSSITVTLRDDYNEALLKEEFAYEPIKNISVIMIANEDVLIQSLQQGDIHMISDSIGTTKAYNVMTGGSYGNIKMSSTRNDFVTTLLFNVGEYGVFKEGGLNGYSKEIRQAISLCIDQQSLIDEVLHGMGNKVGDGLVQDYMAHRLEDANGNYVSHVTNVDKANEILDGTSYKKDASGSRGLTFTVLANPSNEVVVRALATQLRAIGITLEYEAATNTYSEDIKQYNNADFDMIINSVSFGADKLLMFSARYGLYTTGEPRVFNYSGIVDQTLVDLMTRMETTADTAQQYELCREVQSYIAGLYIEIPLYSENIITFYSDSVFEGWTETEGSSIWNGNTLKYLHVKES